MVAVIAGPTAGGKSALALAAAEAIGGTIINADASQMYRDLRIISARPSEADEARVPHLLYGVLDGAEAGSAAGWAGLARAAIAEVQAADRLPILVGGTGLYLSTLIDGIAPVPAIDPAVRAAVRDLPAEAAATALAAEDPALAARLAPADRQRTLRGLEVMRSTGRSLLAWQGERTSGIGAAMAVRGVVVTAPRPLLNARAEARLAAMVEAGALAEVAALVARRLPPDRPVLRALGVPEFAAVLAGEMPLEQAVAAAAAATRQYQKRQDTWFRNQLPGWLRVTGSDSSVTAKVSEFFTVGQM
jgi:tRNA dimethylallyltransferase